MSIYRPISNLSLISDLIIECIVKARLTDHSLF